MEYSQEEIKKRYAVLPEELKDLLGSFEEVNILDEICRNHNLYDNFLEIQKHIALVTLGLENFNDFRIYIFSLCKNESEGKIVYQQIFNMIFLPVMHLINKEGSLPEKKETIIQNNAAPITPKIKQLEPQDNIPLIDDDNNPETPPKPMQQNTIDQFNKIKSMTTEQREELSKYNDNQDTPTTRRSFDSYRETI